MLRRQSALLPPVMVHLDTPSVARVYDYYLGGTTNWEVDRSFGDQVLDKFPLTRRIAFTQRLFLNRVVRHLLRQGVRQFLDVGSGVPSAGATHYVADEWAIHWRRRPDTRVVYVDNDPIAVAHTDLCLDREGTRHRHAALEADLRDPEELWQRAVDTELFNPDQPVALLLIAILHLQQLDAAGNEIGPTSVAKLRERLPLGSYMAISHITDHRVPASVRAVLAGLKRIYDANGTAPVIWRSRSAIQGMLGDLQMIEPGWTAAIDWHPEETGPSAPTISLPARSNAVIWAGVGKKV